MSQPQTTATANGADVLGALSKALLEARREQDCRTQTRPILPSASQSGNPAAGLPDWATNTVSQPQTTAIPAIADGADVVLRALSKAALNGATGQNLGLDASSGRYKIQLVGPVLEGKVYSMTPKPILVKRENLQVVPKKASNTSKPASKPAERSTWSDGMAPDHSAEWFVDCYRMRCDDDYVGGNLHGVYTDEASAAAIVFDFLKFCLLALSNNVVCITGSSAFDWTLCITKFGNLIGSKSDVQKKYGHQNVFLPVMMRATATQVYGMGHEYGSEPGEAAEQRTAEVSEQVSLLCAQEDNALAAAEIDSHPAVFEKVGGRELWREFLLRFEAELPNR
jgi:hypothetical protein